MPVPILLTDSFARANGDANAGFTAYTETPAASWSVSGGQLTSSANPAFLAARVFVPADCRAFGVEANTVGVWGVFARGGGTYNGTSDTYYKADLSATTLTLRKSVSGTLTTLATATVTRAAGAALMLDCVGGTVQAWYNGTLLISVADASITGVFSGNSCGVWNGSTTAVLLSRFDARGDSVYPPTGITVPNVNTWDETKEWSTQRVEYLSGFVQRNSLWVRDKASAAFSHEYLLDADQGVIEDFFYATRGLAIPFIIQRPTWTFLTAPQIGQRRFAVADGISTVYKVGADKASAITTYTDGAVDGAQPTKSLLTGTIFYATAPYAGARLSYDATTPYYRVYWGDDKLTWKRKLPNFWTIVAKVVGDKTLLEGAAM